MEQIEGFVSLKRINKFLNLPKLKPRNASKDLNYPIVIDNGTFSWIPANWKSGDDGKNEEKEKEKEKQTKLKALKSTEDITIDAEMDTNDEKKLEVEGPTLVDITFRVRAGSLVGVIGTVGSGKSSLLSCILGEMECLNGKTQIQQINGRKKT